MKQATLNAIVTMEYVGAGAVLLAVPVPAMNLFDVGLNSGGALMARLFGSVLIGAGIILWGLRNGSSENVKPLNLGNLFYNLAASAILLFATLSKTMGPLGWVGVMVHLLFAIGFGYFGYLRKT